MAELARAPVRDALMGLFYELDIGTVSDEVDWEIFQSRHRGEDWQWSGHPQIPDEDLWLYAEFVESEWDEEKQCSLEPTHVTRALPTHISIQLCGLKPCPPFLMLSCPEVILVNHWLAQQLMDAQIKGIAVKEATIDDNETDCPDARIFYLQLLGRRMHRQFHVVPESANHCPFCGQGSVVCPECGYLGHICPKCGERCLVPASQFKGPQERRLRIPPPSIPIVEGVRWDGSDVLPSLAAAIITHRFLVWLKKIGATPFVARPIPVETDGMTKAEIEKLKEVAQPIHER